MKFNFTKSEDEIISHLIQNGKCYIVGGAIRDSLLGRTPKDLDFATDLLPQETKFIIENLGYICIPDKTAFDHGIIRVVDKETGNLIDIATLRKDDSCDGRHAGITFTESIIQDLSRRDFTINAMAWDIKEKELIDPFNGQKDLNGEMYITSVGNPIERFQEDHLRMIRACRFTALGGTIEHDTERAIKELASNIRFVSKERIHDEIVSALSYPNPGAFFRSLLRCKLLEYIFPTLAWTVGCEGGKHHEETVWNHSILTFEAMCELNTNPMLRLAALLHDVGKYDTQSTDKTGVHFYKHEVVGASLVHDWMTEYKFTKKETDYVSKIIRNHQWRFEDDTKDKTIRKWIQTIGKEDWRDLITIRMADRKGNLAKKHKPMITAEMRWLISKVEYMLTTEVPLFKEDLAINGDDLVALGMKPSPKFKEIFSQIMGIVLSDPERNNREWLLDFVKRNYLGDQ